MSWVLTIAGFAALVILHEFGHFAAAKVTGMRVERFFLFFPPKLVSVTRGETEYGIGMIPLGGFVKITGMNPDELRAEEEALEEEAPLGTGRVAAGRPELATANVAVEGRGAEAAGSRTPDGLLARIEGPSRAPLTPETLKRAYYNQPVWKRVVVIAAGPAMNLLIAFLILFALAFGAKQATTLKVDQVEKNKPAYGALRPGDRIISIDGVRPTNGGARPSEDELVQRERTFADQVDSHACPGQQVEGCSSATPAHVVVIRNGRRVALNIRPFYDTTTTPPRHRLGFAFAGGDPVPVNPSVPRAAGIALDQMWQVTSGTVSVIGRIFLPEQRSQVSSVVGGAAVANEAINFGAREALYVLAFISLSLAIVNLFPFLPLDGGHIFWSLVEKLRGRPVPFATMEKAGAIGFVLILFIFFIGLSNDIGRLTGEGFNIR